MFTIASHCFQCSCNCIFLRPMAILFSVFHAILNFVHTLLFPVFASLHVQRPVAVSVFTSLGIYMLIGYVTVSSFNVTACSAASRYFNIHLTILAHWLRHCFSIHVTTWSLATSLFLVLTSLHVQRPLAVSVFTSLHGHRPRHCF